MKLIDANHALAHLRSARVIISDNPADFNGPEQALLKLAFDKIERIVQSKCEDLRNETV